MLILSKQPAINFTAAKDKQKLLVSPCAYLHLFDLIKSILCASCFTSIIDPCLCSGPGPYRVVQRSRGTIQAGCLLASQEDG